MEGRKIVDKYRSIHFDAPHFVAKKFGFSPESGRVLRVSEYFVNLWKSEAICGQNFLNSDPQIGTDFQGCLKLDRREQRKRSVLAGLDVECEGTGKFRIGFPRITAAASQ